MSRKRGCLGTPPSTARPLLIVLNPRRNVPAKDSLKFSDIDAELHRCRTAKNTDLPIFKITLKLFSNAIVYGSRMLLADQSDVIPSCVAIPGQGGRDSEVDPVSIPKLIRARFRDEAGHGFRF